MKTKNFNFKSNRWNEVGPENNENMRKAGFVLVSRPLSPSILKRVGSMATSISVKPEDLPKNIKEIASGIVSKY